MGWFSRLMVLIGLPAYTCPECGERAGEWEKVIERRKFLGGFFGHGWECANCGWRT